MQDPREIQELMQKGLKELQSMKVRRGVIGGCGSSGTSVLRQ